MTNSTRTPAISSVILAGLLYNLSGIPAAHAQECGERIAGFAQFHFGMSEEKVARTIRLKEAPPEMTTREARDPINILDHYFELEFRFLGDKLNAIVFTLIEDFSGRTAAGGVQHYCKYIFYEFLSLMQAKYCRPDFAPVEVTEGGKDERYAQITTAGGQRISLAEWTTSNPDVCRVSMQYFIYPTGNPF